MLRVAICDDNNVFVNKMSQAVNLNLQGRIMKILS